MKIAAIAALALLAAGCNAPKAGGGGSGGGNPKKQAPTQEVHLIWKGTEWKVKLNNGPEEDPKTAKTTLRDGPTMFVVDIQGKAATFKDPGGLAVWEGSKSASPGSDQILGPIIVTNKNTKQENLIFWDLNQGAKVTLYYGLYFNEPGVPPVDPIIDNGGCC